MEKRHGALVLILMVCLLCECALATQQKEGKGGKQEEEDQNLEWIVETPMPTARTGLGVIALNESGVIFALGGCAHNTSFLTTVEVYVAAGNKWYEAEDLPSARGYFSVASLESTLYIFGGANGSFYAPQYLNSALALDVAASGSSWRAVSSMPTARWGASAAQMGGEIYVFGGANESGYLKTVEVYSPASDSWRAAADMPSARADFGIAVVGQSIYLIGGGTNHDVSTLNLVESYTPATNSWKKLAPMPSARKGLAVAVLDGLIYAIGGQINAVALATTEVFDPATNSWASVVPLPSARAYFGAASVGPALYAIGGYYNFLQFFVVSQNTALTPISPSSSSTLSSSSSTLSSSSSFSSSSSSSSSPEFSQIQVI